MRKTRIALILTATAISLATTAAKLPTYTEPSEPIESPIVVSTPSPEIETPENAVVVYEPSTDVAPVKQVVSPSVYEAEPEDSAEPEAVPMTDNERDDQMREILRDKYGDTRVMFVPQDELTEEMLCSRAGRDILLVEVNTGVVLNEDGDGMLLNADPEYNYISYAGLGLEPSSTVVTYCVYDPNTNYDDDIIERYDFSTDVVAK